MIERVVFKTSIDDPTLARRDLEYWLSRPSEERIAQIERLRRAAHGELPRIPRVPEAVQRRQR